MTFAVPMNLDAERDVLGVLLCDPAKVAEVEGYLRAIDFVDTRHQLIFAAIGGLVRDAQVVTAASVFERIKTQDDFTSLGGIEYLVILADRAPLALKVDGLAKVVADVSLRRRAYVIGQTIMQQASFGTEPAEAVIAQGEGALGEALRGTGSEANWSNGEDLAQVIREKRMGLRKRSYLTTGLTGLDRRTGGLRRGRFTIVAGRPGMGKSAVGLELCRGVAGQLTEVKLPDGRVEHRPTGVALFSLEMDDEELALRMGCAATFDRSTGTGPVYFDVQRDELKSGDWETLQRGESILSQLPFYFDERAKLKPSQIVPAAKRIIRQWQKAGIEPGFIMVDHFHLVTPEEERYGNRAVELGEVSSALALLAKETGVAIIALCQLNRENESRRNSDKRPQLSDLKGTGNLEQDANTVIFLHRPEYYLVEPEDKQNDKEMIEYMDEMMKWEGKIQFLIRKNRGGPNMKDHTMRISLPHNALWEE